MDQKFQIDFNKDIDIREVRDNVNLMLFNSNNFSMEHMKLVNKICEALQNVKLEITVN